MNLFFSALLFLCIFYIVVEIVHSELYYIPESEPILKMKTTNETVPWMGVLRVKYDNAKTEFASVVILVAKHIAIGCAEDIMKIEKDALNTSSSVTFYNKHLVPWDTILTDYFVHPEYGENTINTIAALLLDNEYQVPAFMWRPVKWPTNLYSYENQPSVFNIGFTDKKSVLEQTINRVESVNKRKCVKFYKREGIDFQRIWPTNYNCFKVVDDNQTCVYEAGMAVASNDTGDWTLIGIGTYGPGCSLPARYIEFLPYIPWVKAIIGRTKKFEEIVYRRSNWQNWKEETGEDLDTKLLAILYNDTIDFYPTVPQETYFNSTDRCTGDNEIMYHERGYVKRTSPIPTATVMFSVSLFDDNYDLKCIRIKLKCVLKTKTEVFVQREINPYWLVTMTYSSVSFGQEDIEPMVKQTIEPSLGKTLENGFQEPEKILFLTGEWRDFRDRNVTTVWFKFVFLRTGMLDVIFFGTPKPEPTEKPPETTTKPTERKPHATYLKWDIYNKVYS